VKRARKLKSTRRLPGTVRRRLAKRLYAVQAVGWGPLTYARHPWEIRDTRRLVEAGQCAAAVSRWGWVGPRELTLDVTREALRRRYPAEAMMPGGRVR
jgi:hypothetical protein